MTMLWQSRAKIHSPGIAEGLDLSFRIFLHESLAAPPEPEKQFPEAAKTVLGISGQAEIRD
jgi:hypothetical protein